MCAPPARANVPVFVGGSHLSRNLERAKGIEPSYAAWEAAVLPLNYARSVNSPCISAHDADGRRRFGTRISAKLNSRLLVRDLLPGTRYRQADSPPKTR